MALSAFCTSKTRPCAALNADNASVLLSTLSTLSTPGTVALALSISCVCVLVPTLLVVDAVILPGVPSASVRFPDKLPPPDRPLPAITCVVLSAFSAKPCANAAAVAEAMASMRCQPSHTLALRTFCHTLPSDMRIVSTLDTPTAKMRVDTLIMPVYVFASAPSGPLV